jgi:predicted dehydrogenase
MANQQKSRREFIKSTVAAGAGAVLTAGSASSYARILGANDRINICSVGVRSRGNALAHSVLGMGSAGRIHSLCDVDSNVLAERAAEYAQASGTAPKTTADIRNALEDPEVDAVIIATPDHTHAPFAIYAMQAGKHVYLEKPVSYNAGEGEMLVAVAGKTGQVLQVGNQQRSGPTTRRAIERIHGGVIGTAYAGETWYANTREGIGRGKQADVPGWLDWDLWQGPAPRRPYRDNYVHYNWHWFRHWGTGEINNNAMHELDLCRWALGVDYPTRVVSTGGRYHFDDDWEFFDTQVASYEFGNGCVITWEGRSCNGFPRLGQGRGALVLGTEGSVLLTRNGCTYYDLKGEVVEEDREEATSATTDVIGAGALEIYHLENFFSAIREGDALRSAIADGHKSTLMCHLGNIAQFTGRALSLDPASGAILNDAEAAKHWTREYEPGWAPSV